MFHVVDEAHNDAAKTSIREKCATYLGRAEELQKYMKDSSSVKSG